MTGKLLSYLSEHVQSECALVAYTQSAFICSYLTIETLEQDVK